MIVRDHSGLTFQISMNVVQISFTGRGLITLVEVSPPMLRWMVPPLPLSPLSTPKLPLSQPQVSLGGTITSKQVDLSE
jgi:hypothetical protein